MRVITVCGAHNRDFSLARFLPLTMIGFFAAWSVSLAVPPPLRAGSHDCSILNVPGVATGINNAGVIVGFGGGHGFIRDTAGNVTTVDFPGQTNTQLLAINNHGVITGQWGNLADVAGFFTVDLAGNFKPIALPPPYDSSARIVSVYGINDNGAILVSVIYSSSDQGMFVLHADGTVGVFPSVARLLPGGLNNAGQFLAVSGSVTAPDPAELVSPDGTLTPIRWNTPAGYGPTAAFGLNHVGTVVGSIATTFGPRSGFVRDASGSFSALTCPTLPAQGGFDPKAINDSGVVVGSFGDGSQSFVATPVPGNPVFEAHAFAHGNPTIISISVPVSRDVGGSSVILIYNTGDSRLDLGGPRLVGKMTPWGQPYFETSACLIGETPVVSLNPHESCMVSVTAIRLADYSGVPQDTLFFEDSSSGSTHSFPVSVQVIDIPRRSLYCEVSVSSGPPRQANFRMEDTSSGLASIVPYYSVNITPTIPPFAAGTAGWVSVTATQVDPAQPSKIGLRVTNVAGDSVTCDASLAGSSLWRDLGGLLTSRVAAAINGAGLEDAFVRGADDALWHITRTGLGEGWADWQSFGGILTSDPVVGQNADGRLEVFVLGADRSLWHLAQNAAGSAWSGQWEGLGGILIGDPAVGKNADGRLEVFARGTDQALWHIWQITPGGAWSQWHSLGGVLVSNAAVGINDDGRLEAFALGTDNALWHIAQTAAGADWSHWEGLGGQLTGDPAVARNADGRLEVFGRGGDQALWHLWQTTAGGGWSAWTGLGGVIITNPVAASNLDGSLEVFALGTDTSLWHIRQTGGDWSWWGTLAGGLADQPAVLKTSFQALLEVLVRGTDNRLYTIQQSSVSEWNAGN